MVTQEVGGECRHDSLIVPSAEWSIVATGDSGISEAAGCEWLHVDFDDELRTFYLDACGFTPTAAGVIAL